LGLDPVSSPEISSDVCQIVVIGNFNPAIFSSGWLLANALISEEESEDARPQAIVPQLSIFEVAWLRCEVTTERLLVATGEPGQYERLRDIAAGILDVLKHTPIQSLGINRTFHVRMPSRKSWHRIGDLFAPKEVWGRSLILPGMRDVTVTSVRPDLYSGELNVTLQPSATVKWGFFLAINDHYNLKLVESQPTSRNEFEDESSIEERKAPEPSAEAIPMALEILSNRWAESNERAEALVQMIWDKAEY
jgi:hypothetical protein